jgi:SNF2 family DNA or RNA helicase
MGCVILLREIANDTSLLNSDTSMTVQDMQHMKLLPTVIPKGSNKIPECINIVEEIGTEQVIIFTQFSQMAVKLGAELLRKGYKIKILTGDNPTTERMVEVERFKNNEFQILIATDIFGYGVNLQFCHYMINFDIPWNPAKLNQRIGRIHRQGSDRDKTVINLLSEDIDEHVYEVICGKQDLFDQVVEGKAIDDENIRKQILQKLI